MKQPAFVALVATAFVLYLVASAGAGGVPLDAGSWALAAVASWSALVPLWVKRDELSTAPGLVRALAALLALSLASALAVQVHSLLGELVCVVSLPLLALATLQLAIFAPDVPSKLARHTGSMGLVSLLALLSVGAGVLAVLPPIWLFGRALIFPVALLRAPLAFAFSAFALAGCLRFFRRRLGSDTRALSGNVWPALGLGSAFSLALCAGLLSLLDVLPARALRASLAIAALLLLLGHLWLVSTRRAKVAYAWARELWAWTLACAAASALLIAVALRAQQSWLLVLSCALLFVLLFELGKRGFRRLARVVLAPQRGELLAAIEEIRGSVGTALSYAELSAVILRPLRRASGSPEAAPLLYSLHPVQELRLDAAGFARPTPRSPPAPLQRRLESTMAAPLVRADLRQLLSRRPELRELVSVLDELNALCVLPLITDGTLDGALLVAQGARTDPLSLEELDALEALTKVVAPLLSVMSLVERLNARLSAHEREQALTSEKLRDTTDELSAARAELSLLKASATPLDAYREPICYSPLMRTLCARLSDVAGQDVPLTLVAQAGCQTLQLAAFVHRQGGRQAGPFVVADCSALGADSVERLLGTAGPKARLGLLQLAAGGSLVLEDVAALPLDAQGVLASALSERRASPAGASSWYGVDARIIASSRLPIEELVARHRLRPELARWLATASYQVPALHECREDLESLALLALDRASRVLGRSVPGLAPEALAALKEHDFPFNHRELESVLERAVQSASGVRVELSDLPPLPRGQPGLGSFLDQERDILRRALDVAGGNRTRAARALGLKRTTLIEKLRRLGIDEGRSGTEH